MGRDAGRHRIRRHGMAVAVVALAELARWGLVPSGEPRFALFYLATIVAAGLGGLGPGLLATALGALCLLPEARAAFRSGAASDLWRLVAFETLSVLTVWLIAALGEARRRAEAAAAAARSLAAENRLGEERMRAILDNCPAAIFMKDLEGRFLFVNRSCEPLLRAPRDEVLGKDDREFFSPELAARFRAHDREVLDSGESLQREEEIPGAGGLRTCLSLKFPLIDAAGAPYAVCGISTDITDRKLAERELRQAKEEAEAASRAKDQFLAMLSHELRTPLTPVMLATSALLDLDPHPSEVASTLEMVRRNIEIEARLIDDLLDVTRIRRGKMRLDRHLVDAHVLIRQALGICRSDVDIAGLRLDLDLSAPESHVEADPTRLQQVIWNLVKNAVKFTARGGVLAVRTSNRPAPDGPPRLVVEVTDTGVGISREALTKIFDAFEQGEAADVPRAGGLGLGLAISRSVAEAHGGSLTATSPGRGHGATFALELATAPRPPEPKSAEAPAWALAQVSTLRILLVEDDADTLRIMARLLQRRGHRVVEAADVQTALRAAALGAFDVVISDVGLPDGSGLDLMRRLRAERDAIIGIALSGYGTDIDIQHSREAGFAEHLTKPVDFRRLETILLRLATFHPNGPPPR